MSTPDFSKEVFYKTVRSGGKGGQNVNKVETAVEAYWHIENSEFFNLDEKNLLKEKLKNSINKDGYLIIKSSATRSQLENKAIALEKMKELVALSLIIPKKRKATRISKAAKEKRLESKRIAAMKKQMRRPPKI